MPSSTATRWTAIAAVVAVLAVIVGGVLVQVLVSDDDPADPEPGSGTATAPGTGAAGCEQPPAPPESPQTFDQVPDQGIAEGTTWRATVSTNCGDIVLELLGDKAPQTVSSFIFLAREGYWENSPCHRLVPQGIFVLQCGDPTGTGTGDPGYGYGIENAPADGIYPPGTLAMARTQDPNSNGGQFFIVFGETQLPTEGGGYSVFGRVVEGLDIVERVAQAGIDPRSPNPADGPPAQPVSILDVTVEKA